MSQFLPTPEQMKIFDLISGSWKMRDTETGNIAVNAVAGSGKTTTAVRSIPYAAKRYNRIGFTAFSKEIATTLQGKVEGQCQAGTMHSFGRSLVVERFGNMPLENWKYLEVAKKEFPSWFTTGARGFKRIKPEFAAFLALTKIVREQNIAIDAVFADLTIEIANIAGAMGISLPSKSYLPELIGGVLRCLEIGADNPKTMDFGDMIWLPVHHKLGVNKFDLLFGDEAQDFCPVQQAFFMQLSEKKVIIGDPYQSIMGFAGADTNSFKNLTKWLGARQLPLSVCFRCPTSHLDLARHLVPHIEARSGATEGHIGQVVVEQIIRQAEAKDMILCRSNAPLVSVAYRLLKAGKPALVRGKNIGEGIVGLVEKLEPNDMADLNLRVQKWKEREIAKLVDRDANEDSFTALNDQVECVIEMASNYDTVGEFVPGAKSLFGDDNETRPDQVILSSVHRAKGLETENVTILQPSKLGACGETEESFQQEKNLMYVALTRAKASLNFCGSLGEGYEEGGLHGWVSTIANRKVAPSRKKRGF
jgi:superfamily I DNA/RNA helicase